ncbi:MAG: LacI family DNA-binding transcriptional regulator [Lentisphaeria bacterium]|nr:LacI family DNA-binding transcriptional regulator [Lentisphaeria bacterium]
MMEAVRQQGRQVTVAMLAKHAGVSRVAVYAAFNPDKKTTVGISEKTKSKILAAAEELGYIPNDLARTLVSGRSRNIGLLLQSNKSLMSQRLISECSRLFVGNGYLMISESSENDAKREREILNNFLVRRVDCVIIAWYDYESCGDLREQFGRCGIPIINIRNREPDFPNSAAVSFDEAEVMQQVCGMLYRKGLRRISYAGAETRENSSSYWRLSHLENAVTLYPGLELAERASFSRSADCRAYVASLAGNPCRPQAVVCYNDQIAQLVTLELRLAGIRVPEEIAVTGVDGYSGRFDPVEPTTVRLPVEKMAAEIYRIFSNSDYRGQIVRLAPELLERETTPTQKQEALS